MRKLLSLLAIVMFSLLLTACSQPSQSNIQDKSVTEDSTTETDEIPTSSTLSQPQHSGIYKNETLGFQLTFPSSWDEHFAIRQVRDGYIAVIFWGESDTAKTQADDDTSDITFFYLATESDFVANVGEGPPSKLLGKGKYENIYKVGTFDYPIDNLNPELFKGKVTETELKNIDKDFAKAKEMSAQVDDVLTSFKALS